MVLKKENVDLLLNHFEDFSVMGILLKIVGVESNLIGDSSDGLFLSDRRNLFFMILNKFLEVKTDIESSVFDNKNGALDLPDSICILMNGSLFFRYLIKDMNVIDLGIVSLIKDPSIFFERSLSPFFVVISWNLGPTESTEGCRIS